MREKKERIAIMRKIGTNLGGIAVGEIMARFVLCCAEDDVVPVFDLDGLYRVGRDAVFTFEENLFDVFESLGESVPVVLLNPSERVEKNLLDSDFLRSVCLVKRSSVRSEIS